MSERVVEWVSRGGWLVELLLPRTDAGVAVQLVVVLAVIAALLWRTRRQPDVRLLVFGAGFFTLGLFVLRASH